MTTRYSTRANAQLSPFTNSAYLRANQSIYSLTIFDRCTSELYYQLAKHFDVTQHSDDRKHTGIAKADAGLIDCRSTAINCPQASRNVQPSVFFLLVDGDSYFPRNAEPLATNVELITEAEISNGVLQLRLASHRQKLSHSSDESTTKASNHKIRQPLHAISLFASSLELVVDDQAQKATLSKILSSCNELNNLLNPANKPDQSKSKTKHPKKSAANQSVFTAISSSQPYKIMLIDDDSAVLDATHSLLSEMNCDAYPANNIPEALEILEELDELPDLLIVDYDLGHNTTGEMAVKEICAAAGTRLPAIMVSGSTNQLEKIRNSSDICNVLSKPVDASLLLSTINNALT